MFICRRDEVILDNHSRDEALPRLYGGEYKCYIRITQ